MRERQPGVWELRAFIGRDANGRPRQVSRVFRGGKRAAVHALAELDTKAAAGRLGKPDTAAMTVATLLGRHLANLERLGRSPKTVHTYRRYVETSIVPRLGTKLVRSLTAFDLDSFYADLATAGRKPATIRQIHAILSGALGQAVKRDIVASNVARSASPPTVAKAHITVPTAVQVRAILAAAVQQDLVLGRMLMVAALTGARRGELCALRWCDVDLDAGEVRISHSMLDLPGRVEMKDTKSHAERTVALDPAAVAMLSLHFGDAAQRAADAEVALLPDGYVFSTTSLDGSTPVRPDWLTSFFNRVRIRLGYEGLTLHGLRHFVATQLASRGDVSPRTLAGRLGHADASVTMRVHAAFFPAADVDAAAHMARVLTAPEPD